MRLPRRRASLAVPRFNKLSGCDGAASASAGSQTKRRVPCQSNTHTKRSRAHAHALSSADASPHHSKTSARLNEGRPALPPHRGPLGAALGRLVGTTARRPCVASGRSKRTPLAEAGEHSRPCAGCPELDLDDAASVSSEMMCPQGATPTQCCCGIVSAVVRASGRKAEGLGSNGDAQQLSGSAGMTFHRRRRSARTAFFSCRDMNCSKECRRLCSSRM
mmetsp:Transcript_75305/g.208541  ORF Transcript_75305/g.208541 Transcript_75305/m.208541 type:complete len:219 (+) Transcript_75305:30-686(+)